MQLIYLEASDEGPNQMLFLKSRYTISVGCPSSMNLVKSSITRSGCVIVIHDLFWETMLALRIQSIVCHVFHHSVSNKGL